VSERGPVLGVGAIVVRDGALLMVRRAKDPGRGLWSLPGGRVRHGEYLGDALRREVREETGIEVEVEGLAGIFEVVGSEHHFVILDFSATAFSDEAVPGGYADAARWVPLEEVPELDTTPRFVETLRGWGVL
jgi:8-oxo-dGTP diphosphatase